MMPKSFSLLRFNSNMQAQWIIISNAFIYSKAKKRRRKNTKRCDSIGTTVCMLVRYEESNKMTQRIKSKQIFAMKTRFFHLSI